MHDPHAGWDQQSYADDQGTGLVWRTARNIGILLVGCLLLAGGLSRVDEPAETEQETAAAARQVPDRPAPVAARPGATGDELIIPVGRNGHYMVDAVVDGIEIQFLVDTGATSVVLKPEDAERLGYRLEALEYSERFQTANGVILGAPVVLPELRIGDMEIEDVRSTVINTPLSTSLLGMTFLSRLESFEVREEGLILRW